jgi:CDP-2,3-bis-(O-geranylgeranyl)-sn-glycerol synthase
VVEGLFVLESALVGLQLLVLLLVANGAPILAHDMLGQRGARPSDGGRRWTDGNRLLGSSKTWRGLIVGVGATALAGLVVGLGLIFSAGFGLLALIGDLVSSFIKRRLKLRDSARATGLDQVPEALLPVAVCAAWLDYGLLTVVITVALFVIINMAASPVLYRLGLRRHPH